MDEKKIGEFLKTLRKAKGLTQQDVADALYVTQKTVSRWETGEGVPDINILTTVASFYEITVDELLNGERQKPNQSAYTTTLKEGERIKLLKNKILGRSNSFGIAAIAIACFFFLLNLFIGLFASELAGVIIGGIGTLAAIGTFLYGRKDSINGIAEADIETTLEERKRLKDAINKANIVYIDVIAAVIILSGFLFSFYLLPVNPYYGTNPFTLMFSLIFNVGVLVFYLLFRYDSVAKCNYSYKAMRRSLVIGLGIIEIIAMGSFFTITLGIPGAVSNETITAYLSMLVFQSIGTPYTARMISFFILLAIVVAMVYFMIKGKAVVTGSLALAGLFIPLISFTDLFMGIFEEYEFRGLMPNLWGSLFLIASIALFVVIIKKDKKLKSLENAN